MPSKPVAAIVAGAALLLGGVTFAAARESGPGREDRPRIEVREVTGSTVDDSSPTTVTMVAASPTTTATVADDSPATTVTTVADDGPGHNVGDDGGVCRCRGCDGGADDHPEREDRSGPGSGGDVDGDHSGPGSGVEERGRDRDRSGRGGGDDGERDDRSGRR